MSDTKRPGDERSDSRDSGRSGRSSGSLSRRDLLKTLGVAGGGALLYQAPIGLGVVASLAAQTPAPIPQGAGAGRHVVIIGAGVAGLTAAYRLQQANYRCTVLEARPRVGGRSLTLRHDDVLVENPLEPYRDTRERESRQRCDFQPAGARGYDRPYLNAGPGRIPSAHVHVLELCKELSVPLEVYIMESRSNLVRGRERGPTRVNRHIANDARGRISEALFALASQVPGLSSSQQRELQDLLIQFGSLGTGEAGERGVYAKGGKYERSTRAGYETLPGVEEGVPVEPFSLPEVLATGFWNTRFYQPEDFLWQSTLFQPVGGMDRIVHALADAVGRENIRTDAPVTAIRYDGETKTWRIETEGGGSVEPADACISNVPIPLLREPLGELGRLPFSPAFREALQVVFRLPTTGLDGFLGPSCKVGWQAPRALWQEPDSAADRVVPIFGGISWTHHPLTQIWYPSEGFFDELGVLTGAYNFGGNAVHWGDYSPGWRLDRAREGAGNLAGKAFSDGLGAGLSIAWQNIAHLRGAWAQWQSIRNQAVRRLTYNTLVAGARESGFFLCGDQLSQLPGWKEGAVVSALNATSLLGVPTYTAPEVESVPDSRVMVEGLVPVEP